MKKINLILVILFTLLLLTFANAGKCWYVTELSGVSPNVNWGDNTSSEQICIDGNCWNRIVFSNSVLTITGFGTYNMLCDNGANQDRINFGVLTIANDQRFGSDLGLAGLNYNKKFTNVTGNRPAADVGLAYCRGNNTGFNILATCGGSPCTGRELYDNSTAVSEHIGQGTEHNIYFRVLDEFGPELSKQITYVGGYSIDFSIMKEPIAGTYGKTPISNYFSTDPGFFFAPPPSLFVLPLGDDTVGFYEKDGNYVKDVYFTVKAQTYLQLTVKNLELECHGPSGTTVTCALDSATQPTYTMARNNDTLIVNGTITVPKDNIPKSITYNLNLQYDVTNLRTVGPEYRDIDINSSISRLNLGYLDKQDFQVKIIGSMTDESCVGYNGLIGTTGEAVAPRINVNTNFPNIYDENICSPENNNWVYCSQRETLAVLTNKIWELFNLYYQAEQATDDDVKNALYTEINNKKTFEIYIRNIDLSDADTILPENTDLFENDPFGILSGATQMENITRAKKLFNEVQFFNTGGISLDKNYSVGKYIASIDMFGQRDALGGTDIFHDLSAFDVDADFSSNVLFDADGELIEPEKLNIQINLTKTGGEPLLNWFFYEEGVESLTDQITPEIPTLYETQIGKRGQVMTFDQDLTDFELGNIKTYPSYAIPLFVKVDKNETNLSNKLILTASSAVDQVAGLIGENKNMFSYWTGFGSNLENGCGEILSSEDSLIYRLEDKIENSNSSSAANEYLIELYPSTNLEDLENGKEYLQTVIYVPIFAIGNPFSATIKSNTPGLGNSLFSSSTTCAPSSNCEVQINKNNSTHIVDTSSSISDIINGIKNSNICVTTNQSGLDSVVNWNLFWNEEKILKNLQTNKTAVLNSDTDSKYCAGLER